MWNFWVHFRETLITLSALQPDGCVKVSSQEKNSDRPERCLLRRRERRKARRRTRGLPGSVGALTPHRVRRPLRGPGPGRSPGRGQGRLRLLRGPEVPRTLPRSKPLPKLQPSLPGRGTRSSGSILMNERTLKAVSRELPATTAPW